MLRGIGKWIAVSAMLLASVIALAACGSSGSSSESTSSSSGEETETAASGGGEGGELCVSALVGIGLVPNFIKGYTHIGELTGLSVTKRIANPQGDLNSSLEQIRTCIQENPKVMATISTENQAAAAAVNEAISAGIPYIGDFTGEPLPGMAGNVEANNAAQAENLVKFTKENLVTPGETLKVLILTANELPAIKTRADTFLAGAEKEGWEVTGPVELGLSDPAGTATQKVSAALASEEFNVIMSPWSDPTAGVLAALRQSGDSNIKVLDYDGDVNIFSQMEQGAPVVAVSGQALGSLNKIRQIMIEKILAGENPKGAVMEGQCYGPIYTPENIPTTEEYEDNEEGQCEFEGKEYSSAEIAKLAGKG